MSRSDRIPFHVEINQIIELLAKQIYQSPMALLRENCQNAYDAILQRRFLGESFQPQIKINLTPTEIIVEDNGIGMDRNDLTNHYWRAGSSGKNNPEARAAGVVGTFGIGAMANFGIANTLTVITESARNGERTRCLANRETLSATEDCIEMITEESQGSPGTIIITQISPTNALDITTAQNYIKEFVRHLDFEVLINDTVVSMEDFDTGVKRPPISLSIEEKGILVGPELIADLEMIVAKSGEVWIALNNIHYSNNLIDGVILLRQGLQQVRTFRSRFALANTVASSSYNFGGIANLPILEPTAGREALTTQSIQLIQTIITECDKFVSEKIAGSPLSNSNTCFMDWVARHNRFELCSNMSVRVEPNNESLRFEEVKIRCKNSPLNYFEGSDKTLITEFATEEQPLIVISTTQPRRRCELGYISTHCQAIRIVDSPQILQTKSEPEWTITESALALRLISILEVDYFLNVLVIYGKISHGLPIYIDTTGTPIKIVLDLEGSTVAMILKMYDEDFSSLSGLVKDFVRNIIFPKVSSFVPSSTRQGAEAFLRVIRKPREVFEYQKSDLGSFSEIWEDFLEGKISLSEAAQQSTTIVKTNVQIVDNSTTSSVASVIPDVLRNEEILEDAQKTVCADEFDALPAIIRLDKESSAKLLTINDCENPLKGYRCFLALSNGVRQDRGDFFLQPHRTEIVWGGQKALYIFQHHSGEFALYYELQSSELLSDEPGGRAFPTCTIMLNNQIYIPVPSEIHTNFIPRDNNKKRFEIRCELLYPEVGVGSNK